MIATIGIVTINNNKNYGNRLQNYALANILKKYNDNVSTINLYLQADSRTSYIKSCISSFFKHLVLTLASNTDLNSYPVKIHRTLEGNFFTLNSIPNQSISASTFQGLKLKEKLSVEHIVIGSDQVWNYQWLSKDDLALRLGSFAPDDIPIISYAASFGVSEVSDDVRPIFQKYLPRLKAISVREDRGAELVKEITGLDATVVLDPTLMLDTEQWNIITRGFVRDDDRYVLTYFLGKPSEAQEKTIQNYAKVHGCRIRRILDLRDKETYIAGPQDFVELFSKAQYVFTDSYHACCFSILFHKQFAVFNRAGMEGKASMNSRMETLFRLFDLDSVVMDEGMAPEIDYDKVDKLLAQHRAESQAWLDKAMEA